MPDILLKQSPNQKLLIIEMLTKQSEDSDVYLQYIYTIVRPKKKRLILVLQVYIGISENYYYDFSETV